jgi:hypothetical protein
MSEEEGARGAFGNARAESGIYRDRANAGRLPERSSPRMWLIVCFLAVLGVMLGSSTAQNLRVIQGRVVDSNEQSVQNAIVYLEDQKSMEIKTYITEADGKFRFGQISSDVDYHVWAKYQDHKSKTKSISSFDSKKLFDFELKIDTGK